MGHGEPFQRRHLGAAVGNDHQLRFPRRQSGIHQRGKCCADTLTEFRLAFPARAAAFAAGFHPGAVLGVVLHLPVIAALKHAKVMFIQSHVPAHAELAWVLNCFTMFGEASRMTQFKDKSAKHADNINVGLFTYPVLMAADILLYQTDLVPVGVDQSQHIEICRDIANRFNNLHPNTFTIPEGYYPKVGEGAKITSLVDPNSKMSKSDPNPNGYILLMDKPEDIMRKFKRAVTDSDSRIIFDPQNKPGVSNLLQIYALATGKTIEQAAAEFDGKGYGEFKPAVGEAVVELLRPIREKTTDLLNNKDYLEQVYKEGAQKASYLARKTLDKVYRKVGFVAR